VSDLRAPVPSSVWRSVLAVMWAFVGLRQRSEFQQDTARVNPLHLIAVGLGLCLVFVVSLMFFVKWVVAQ
jgi:Protein of unknown function (DUF2970)